MKLYVVRMLRWGDSELHSYIEGVYDTEVWAKRRGEFERNYRGGKYEYQIEPYTLNESRRFNLTKDEK